ncbi:receptor like protein 3-like isoform X4 [Vigna radiata var. radiata]|uniref:Receptor like protein 3-like isoform X4 n=1 Tax=Vigna radiata var. radiata TaxID=3916 RepID=A0A3Q0ESJ9_VIGRR|nr:receptor like protein 3-like isoform X4 [Vigna radiata var. radiata]
MTFLSQFSLLFLSLFYVFTFQNILCSNLSQLRCNEKDRQILQIFKEGLINSSNNLISWSTQQDCCQWQGVYCDNTSSRVTKLDLSYQSLQGSIPQITYNITDMMVDNYSTPLLAEDGNIDFYQKGQVYDRELDLDRRTIDLSANKISGEIPSELFRLIRVQTLNLSYNHLTGTIPKTIGGMKNLESLDLSNNKLFGEIPENMATLTFLSYLNLSCNNFSGQIPIGTQLQSFSVSSYDGNPELCGDPLKKCSMKKIDVNRIEQRMKEDGEFDEESLYLGMGVGFAVGFCGLFGSLLSFRKWRHKYYRLLNRMYDQLYVTYMLKFNNFLNREALQ